MEGGGKQAATQHHKFIIETHYVKGVIYSRIISSYNCGRYFIDNEQESERPRVYKKKTEMNCVKLLFDDLKGFKLIENLKLFFLSVGLGISGIQLIHFKSPLDIVTNSLSGMAYIHTVFPLS